MIDTLAKPQSTQREKLLMIENEIEKNIDDIAVQVYSETDSGLLEMVSDIITAHQSCGESPGRNPITLCVLCGLARVIY